MSAVPPDSASSPARATPPPALLAACGQARRPNAERARHVARGLDGVMRAGRQAQAAARARLVDDSDLGAFYGDGVGRAHSHARHTGHAKARIDPKVHVLSGRGAAASSKSVYQGAKTCDRRHTLSMGT